MSRPIAYIKRIRDYYLALGYDKPYQWARYEDVPLTIPPKPGSKSKIAIITTAAPYKPGAGEQGPGAPYNGAAKFFEVYSGAIDPEPDLYISHIAIDRTHTSAEDQGTFFPLAALNILKEQGRIESVNHRFFGLPTNRSQRITREIDAVEILLLCREDYVDAAILVPNCPVCHQSVAITANLLEQSGIATVIMGCARDIIEHIGVPRFLFSDFPLGNSTGKPGDKRSQLELADMALDLLFNCRKPRTTIHSQVQWSATDKWKEDYSNHLLLSPAQLIEKRREFDTAKAAAAATKTRPE